MLLLSSPFSPSSASMAVSLSSGTPSTASRVFDLPSPFPSSVWTPIPISSSTSESNVGSQRQKNRSPSRSLLLMVSGNDGMVSSPLGEANITEPKGRLHKCCQCSSDISSGCCDTTFRTAASSRSVQGDRVMKTVLSTSPTPQPDRNTVPGGRPPLVTSQTPVR